MFGLTVSEIISTLDPRKIINPRVLPVNIKGVSLDTRTLKKGEAFLALEGKRLNPFLFLNFK